ncbi:hypothetical protein ABKW26_12995, partial [Sanguibacter sp. 25GB23B1]
GTHNVCIYAINNVTGHNPLIGCRTITVVNATPIGAIDVARASGPDTIQLRGWVLDPDTTDPIDIHVYVGSTVTPVRAELPRPDVDTYYAKGADHGYDITIPTKPGTHNVCIYAINNVTGHNPLIGCRTITT